MKYSLKPKRLLFKESKKNPKEMFQKSHILFFTSLQFIYLYCEDMTFIEFYEQHLHTVGTADEQTDSYLVEFM